MPCSNRPATWRNKQQAAQSAEERNQPQGIFIEAQEFDERQLPPKEQRRSDLAVVQRLEQLAVAAVEQIRREHGLVFPEGESQQVAGQAERQPDEHEGQQPSPLGPGRKQVLLAAKQIEGSKSRAVLFLRHRVFLGRSRVAE